MSSDETQNFIESLPEESLENSKKGSSFADGQEMQKSDIKAKEKISSQITKTSEHEPKQNVGIREIQEHEIDQDFYNEILEKLDIKTKDKKQDIQEKPMQENLKQEAYLEKIKNLEKLQVKTRIEKAISEDFAKIQKLLKGGLISSVQGQNLKKQVLKKAFDKLVQAEKIKRTLPSAPKSNNQALIKNAEVFEEFSKNNPNFFTSNGRKEVLNYLKSGDVTVGKDELNKISDIIRVVEKAAIDRYLQKVAHEKTLKNSNESAKQRLKANAQQSGFSGNLSRTFTREQIGKMSSAEFAKYESAIMEQLKKGFIR